MRALGVFLAVLSGVGMAGQAAINARLARHTGDPVLVAFFSFASGLAILLLVLPFAPRMRAGIGKVRAALISSASSASSAGAANDAFAATDAVKASFATAPLVLRRWHLLGGLGGATIIVGQALTVGVLGVAIFTIGVVAGQTVSGLLVDRYGLGPAGVRPLTAARAAGASLMFVAVLVTVWGGLEVVGAGTWLLLLPLGGGVAIAVQQAINGRVGAVAGNPLTATLGNFTVGAGALLLLWLVAVGGSGGPDELPGDPVLYLSGPIGVGVIAVSVLVVHWVGVLLLGLGAVAGQLIGSLLLDLGLPAHEAGVPVSTMIGIGLAFLAIGVASARRTVLRE